MADRECTLRYFAIPIFLGLVSCAEVPEPHDGAANLRPGPMDVVYANPSRLIDIGGRRLNLVCMGLGSPTVIFDSASEAGAWDWRYVQPEIAKFTRACSYDRAGMRFSDASQRATNAVNIVDDLDRLLLIAEIPPPYIIVGHTLGRPLVRRFAREHPREVAGSVLVDPTHENVGLERIGIALASTIDETYARYPRPDHLVPPRYPSEALSQKLEGEVEIAFVVHADGSVGDPRVVRSLPAGIFDESAIAALNAWKYRAREVGGTRIDTPDRRAVIRFRLS